MRAFEGMMQAFERRVRAFEGMMQAFERRVRAFEGRVRRVFEQQLLARILVWKVGRVLLKKQGIKLWRVKTILKNGEVKKVRAI